MYKVGIYLRVRKACFVEGMSVREAARVFGLHRDTERKMLEYSVPPGYRRQRPARRPKLDPYKGVMDQILEEDQGVPKKQRHTAKRICERLRDEHGFPGKYTIVKDYVRERRRRTREMFVPLSHSTGTCPVRLRRSVGGHRRSGTQSPLLRPGPPSQRRVLCEGVSRRDDGVILRRTRLRLRVPGRSASEHPLRQHHARGSQNPGRWSPAADQGVLRASVPLPVRGPVWPSRQRER